MMVALKHLVTMSFWTDVIPQHQSVFNGQKLSMLPLSSVRVVHFATPAHVCLERVASRTLYSSAKRENTILSLSRQSLEHKNVKHFCEYSNHRYESSDNSYGYVHFDFERIYINNHSKHTTHRWREKCNPTLQKRNFEVPERYLSRFTQRRIEIVFYLKWLFVKSKTRT